MKDRAYWRNDSTDREGRCTFAKIAPGQYAVHLTHDSLGSRLGIPVEIRMEESDEIVLVLEAEATVAVQMLDGSEPQIGVACMLMDKSGSLPMLMKSSDAGGF